MIHELSEFDLVEPMLAQMVTRPRVKIFTDGSALIVTKRGMLIKLDPPARYWGKPYSVTALLDAAQTC